MTVEEAARILRIDEKTATEEVVRQARRLLAKGLDDKNLLTNESLQELNEAVDVLSSAISGKKGHTDDIFVEDKQESTLKIATVDEQIQDTISNMRKIFDAQREEIINNGPFNTADLEAFYEKYHKLITDANEELLRLKKYKQEHPTVNSEEKQLPSVIENKKDLDSDPTYNNETLRLSGPTLKDAKLGLPEFQQDRGLYQIIHDLTKGLNLKKNDHKTLRASNIQIKQSFLKELQSGHALYNIVHFVPAVMKVPVQVFTKLKNHIFKDEGVQKRIEALKERVNKLSQEDIKTIYENYRSNRVTQEKYPTILNDLLNNKVHNYVMEKVNQLNNETKKGYLNIFSTCRKLDAINDMLKREDVEERVHTKLEEQKKKLLTGKANLVKQIRENQEKARSYFSGGLHGFEEDMKAAESKMSYVGRRFAKTYDMDEVLAKQQAQIEREEKYAIRTENDELAFKAFVSNETLLSKHTKMKESILGKTSVGKKDYNPLAEMLNYRPDPFVRDLFSTIAVTSAAYSGIHGMMTNIENKNILAKQQEINAHNEAVMEQVKEAGRDITAKSDTFKKGIEAQSNQAIHGASNTLERAVLDKNQWYLGSREYHADDAMAHDFYNNLYQDTENAFASVADEYAKGAISRQDALGAFTDIARGTQDNLNHVYEACKPIMEEYAKKHPKFDLQGSLETMDFLVQNPTAIADMNQAIFETVGIGENLQTLNVEQLEVLSELPVGVSTTLLNAAATTAFAVNVANNMATNEKVGKYGNEVTQMVEEYVANSNGPETISLGTQKTA